VEFPTAGVSDGVVRLRIYSERDVPALVWACADPEISRWTLVPSPYTKEDATKWIAATRIERDRGAGYHFLAVDPQGDRLLGAVGVEIKRAGERRYGTAGYWVAAGARGRGIATRAVRLLTDWAFDALEIEWMQLVIDPENKPSRRVAERAGYQLIERKPASFGGQVVEFDHYRCERVEPSAA